MKLCKWFEITALHCRGYIKFNPSPFTDCLKLISSMILTNPCIVEYISILPLYGFLNCYYFTSVACNHSELCYSVHICLKLTFNIIFGNLSLIWTNCPCNIEDISLKKEVNQAADRLKAVIAPFVESSKLMAINMSDQVGHILLFKFNVIYYILVLILTFWTW